jgi:hypothetical protein
MNDHLTEQDVVANRLTDLFADFTTMLHKKYGAPPDLLVKACIANAVAIMLEAGIGDIDAAAARLQAFADELLEASQPSQKAH